MDVLMPQLGETVAEGKIVKWFKQAGDAVKPGENLFEIETDKTSMEVPAIAAGTLTDIRFGVGEVAKVGAVVAVIAGAGGAMASAPQAKPVASRSLEAKPASQSPLTPATAGAQTDSTKELGPRFRRDERVIVQAQTSRDFSYSNMSPWREVRTPERNYGPARNMTGRHVTPLARRLASERGIDLNRIAGSGPQGRIVAADIDKAPAAGTGAQATPQYYLVADIEIGRLLAMQAEAQFAGAQFSLGDFVVKAWAVALRRIMPAAGADIGVQSHVGGRPGTVIIHDAAAKTLTAIAREAAESQGAATAGAASAVALAGASGIREFTAVLTPPLASVLAVGQPRRAPVEAEDGSVKFVSQMTVTLTCNAGVIDQAIGIELLSAFKTLAENPVAALV